jgi:hypothetical protein
MRARTRRRLGALAVAAGLATAGAAAAACRVSDFMDRPLSALSPVERLAFIAQMTPTEFARIRQAGPSGPYADPLILGDADLMAARAAAQAKLDALHLENSGEYQKVWASGFLPEAALERYVKCGSEQRPGLHLAAKPGADGFTLVLAHYLPVGVEKITLRVVASDNIANVADLKAFLRGLGQQDYFAVTSFPLKLAEPGQPAVLILRSGFEHPVSLYLPVYPPPEVR